MGPRSFICIIFSLCFVSVGHAVDLPKGLDHADRLSALRILGPGSAYKVLGDPYPLGGYTGLEIGFSYEVLPVSGLAKLGSGTGESTDTSFFNLTVGKGLFRDVDLFLHFAPAGQWQQFSSFGAAARWGFYELPILPMHFSLQIAGTSAGYANKINTTTQSLDLLGGWNFEDVVVYAGIGFLRSSGVFIGGAGGVTDTAETMTESITSAHSLLGVSFKYSSYFLALQMDRSTEAAFAAKIGTRF